MSRGVHTHLHFMSVTEGMWKLGTADVSQGLRVTRSLPSSSGTTFPLGWKDLSKRTLGSEGIILRLTVSHAENCHYNANLSMEISQSLLLRYLGKLV